jgi:hypothetical protein
VLVHQRHKTAHLVERWIFKPLFPFQGFQPMLNFERFDAERNPVAPSWQQAITEHSLAAVAAAVPREVISRESITASGLPFSASQSTTVSACGESDEEITIFDSTGMPLQDVAAAAFLYEKAQRQGCGIRLNFAA